MAQSVPLDLSYAYLGHHALGSLDTRISADPFMVGIDLEQSSFLCLPWLAFLYSNPPKLMLKLTVNRDTLDWFTLVKELKLSGHQMSESTAATCIATNPTEYASLTGISVPPGTLILQYPGHNVFAYDGRRVDRCVSLSLSELTTSRVLTYVEEASRLHNKYLAPHLKKLCSFPAGISTLDPGKHDEWVAASNRSLAFLAAFEP
jgi:hypothetical protein